MMNIDPSLDYDYEDTPRFLGQLEIEKKLIEEIQNERNE